MKDDEATPASDYCFQLLCYLLTSEHILYCMMLDEKTFLEAKGFQNDLRLIMIVFLASFTSCSFTHRFNADSLQFSKHISNTLFWFLDMTLNCKAGLLSSHQAKLLLTFLIWDRMVKYLFSYQNFKLIYPSTD